MNNLLTYILRNVPCIRYITYDGLKLSYNTPVHKTTLVSVNPHTINTWLNHLCTKQHRKISYANPCTIFRSILPNGLPIEVHATGSMLTPINMGSVFCIEPLRVPNVIFK